jgi:hypothetical protein
MEPFWLIVGMVVFANKLEADAAEVVENDGDVRAVIVKTVKTA